MQWTGLNELREKYLHYFEGKGHLRLGSFPLVPKDDPSLLLINSGLWCALTRRIRPIFSEAPGRRCPTRTGCLAA